MGMDREIDVVSRGEVVDLEIEFAGSSEERERIGFAKFTRSMHATSSIP